LTFARLHKLVTYVLAGLGLFALTLGRELSMTSTALIALGYVASWFAERPFIGRPGYTKMWNRIVIGFFVVQILRGVAGAPLLALGIEYAAFLQISRLAHRRTSRDHQHIAVLAFLHLIAGTVLTTGLDYGVVFFGFVVVTPWMLALTHLRTEIEGNFGAHAQDPDEDVRRVLSSKRVAGPRFLLGTSLLSVPLFAVTAAFFMLFPRVGMGFLSFGTQQGQHVAGFGRNVQLGGFGTIRDDPRVVLRVRVPGKRPESGMRPDRTFRLRGTAFDHYDGEQWTRTPGSSERLPHMFGRYPLLRWPEPQQDKKLHIVLDPLDEPVLFLPRHTVGLEMEPRMKNGRKVPRQLVRARGMDVRYVDGNGLRLRYDAYVSKEADGWLGGTLGDEARERYLQMPPGQQRLDTYAQRIVDGTKGDRARAEKLLEHLRDSGEYRYTLKQPDTEGRDPLEVFLFDAKAGHCEYFSTAMALMLRAVGIPSRNVTGFVGGSYNQYGDYYAIRHGDAHSWVEAYVDGTWVTYDPTPPAERAAAAPEKDAVTGLRDILDALQVRWSQHVVGYDLQRQVDALRELRDWFDWMDGGPAAGREPQDGPFGGAKKGAARRWAPALAAAAVALLALSIAWGLLRWVRRRRRGRRLPGPKGDAVALYQDLEHRLERAGWPRPPSRTPLEHAGSLEQAGFVAARTVHEVTRAYLDARFGDRTLTPQQLQRLRRRLREDIPGRRAARQQGRARM
jgi:transglutaminase-like putative cysteine protease